MAKSLAEKVLKAEHWRYLSWSRLRFGLVRALLGYAGILGGTELARAKNKTVGKPLFVRPGTIDQRVYDEVFVDKEYVLELGDPEFILDAGAHIGMSSVYFASRYPNATVVAVEPDVENFKVLSRNAAKWPNIKPINAGLWRHKARLKVDDPSVESWGITVSETDTDNGLEGLGVADIMNLFGVQQIDVLKLDVEGSEIEVLGNSAGWMASVKTLVVELHDRMRPGCSAALQTALEKFGYDESVSGEKMVFKNLQQQVTA